jgi:hypothetical protein
VGGRLRALADPIDPAQRRLAEGRLVTVLRRHQRRSPLRPDLRVDALVAALRAGEPARPLSHRGRGAISLTDAELRQVVDGMVESGTLLRTGHRVQLPGEDRALDPVMRRRVDQLLATLAAAGATPPPVEPLARGLGLPEAMLAQLRAAGELVSVAPRIDYARETWEEIAVRLDQLPADGVPSVRLVRDELATTRRHAEAVLRRWSRDRRAVE